MGKIMMTHNHDTWHFGPVICKLFKTITTMNFLVSITFLTLMAYDRNRAIQGNYRPSRRKGAPKSVHITAALVWIIGFLFATPTFIKATVKSHNCFENWGANDVYQGEFDEKYFENKTFLINMCSLNDMSDLDNSTFQQEDSDDLFLQELSREFFPEEPFMTKLNPEFNVEAHIDPIFDKCDADCEM